MVWSDPDIKRLSKEFVTVADEIEKVYPEHAAEQERMKDAPAFKFMKEYARQVPKEDWAETGTKQGIYMIGPEGEYLEGRWAAASNAPNIRDRLERALDRWNAIRKAKGYENKPVSIEPWSPPPGIEGSLVLRVNSRDLPRGEGDKTGARFYEVRGRDSDWDDYFKWAWNENWIMLASPRDLVPDSGRTETVAKKVVTTIATKAMIDNVRGKAPEWRSDDAKEMYMTMRVMSSSGDRKRIEYRGRIWMAWGGRGYDAKLYGQGVWDGRKFESLDIVALGMRYGTADHNQRQSDLAPAPMGVTLSLSKQ